MNDNNNSDDYSFNSNVQIQTMSSTNHYPAPNNTYQNPEDIYQNVGDNNYVHQQNMIHNYLIHQNQNHGEIYKNVTDNNYTHQIMIHNYFNIGNNNYVHQNMFHITIYQNLEDIYQNVGD